MNNRSKPSLLATTAVAIALSAAITFASANGAIAQQAAKGAVGALAASPKSDGSADDVSIRWSKIQEKSQRFQARRAGRLMSATVPKDQRRGMMFKKSLDKLGSK